MTTERDDSILALFGREPADSRWQSMVDSAEYLSLVTYFYLRSQT